MRQIFLTLFNTIMGIPEPNATEEGATLFKHIDKYNAQPEFLDEGIPFHTPAAFIEIREINWEDVTGGIQKGNATIRIHVVQHSLADTYQNNYQGSENQEKAMQLFQTLDWLHFALQGLQIGSPNINCSPLSRKRTISDTRHDIVSVDILEYMTIINDEQTKEPIFDIIDEISISGEIDKLPPAVVGSPNPYIPGPNDFDIS
jgi:hypothetical protein